MVEGNLLDYFNYFDIHVMRKSGHHCRDIKKALLPITSKTYWYITAYFTVWIVSPLLNIIVERGYTAFIWICLLASLFVLSVVITTSGNNAMWLSLLYVIGATIKKSDFGNKSNLLTGVSGYLLSVYLTWRAIIIQEHELFNWNRYAWSFFVGRSDGSWPSSITMVVAAVSILVIGFNLKISNKSKEALIKYTPLILSVYLIHVNPLIFDLLNGAFVALSKLNVVIEVMSILMLSGIIFFICIFLDYWRDKLFAMVKNNIANSK